MTDEMKPVRCGCGGEAHYEAYENYNFGSYIAHIMICDKCGMRTAEWPSEAEAISAWNRAMGADQFREVTKKIERTAMMTNHEVACLLADLFDDPCACNYNGIDEWLPEKCELQNSCPNPVGVACWEQFLKYRGDVPLGKSEKNGED